MNRCHAVMRTAIGLSLVTHGVALALAPPLGVPPPTPVVLTVQLAEPSPKPRPPERQQPVRTSSSSASSSAMPSLSGGGAMSDPEVESMRAAVAVPTVQSLQAAPSEVVSTVAKPVAVANPPAMSTESLSSARPMQTAQGMAAPARLQSAMTATGAGHVQPSVRTSTGPSQSDAEGVASVRGRHSAPDGTASRMQVATGLGPVGRSAGAEVGAAVTAENTGAVRRSMAEATHTAHLKNSGTAGPMGKRAGFARGGLSSADAEAVQHTGPETLHKGLLTVGVGGELGLESLATAPASGVFKAALGRDGHSCFKPPPKHWRAEGRVILRITVDLQGQPREVSIVESSGFAELDELARSQAAGCAHFVVQNRRGEALAKTLRLPILYRIENAW